MKTDIVVRVADLSDEKYASEISNKMELSAKQRGSGIAKRSSGSIIQKIKDGKGVIALTSKGVWAGFSYIETWSNGEFVSNSGLIVSPAFRGGGIASRIKQKIFTLSKKLFPNAKIFSITTGLAIMKMNARLGFETVAFNEITSEKKFWVGCKSCVNYSILTAKHCRNCLCTAMLYTPVYQNKMH